jgi:hypothetical protein
MSMHRIEVDRDSDLQQAGPSGDRLPWDVRFSPNLRPVPGPTFPPFQWVPGLSQGKSTWDVALTNLTHLVLRLNKG